VAGKMNKALFFILFSYLSPIAAIVHAQNTITIAPEMFTGNGEIALGTLDGWQYREGHDTTWAQWNIDISDWRNFKPQELTANNADNNGRAEGWFRLRFTPDTSFVDMQLGLRFYCWAAIDLYVDGKFIQSFGSTGADGQEFLEFNPNQRLPVLVDLAPGTEHLIAFHFVDWKSTISPRFLRSADLGMHQFIKLTGPAYYESFDSWIKIAPIHATVLFTVALVLSLLFLLLASLTPSDKTLWVIAVLSIFHFTSLFVRFIFLNDNGLSYSQYSFLDDIEKLCLPISILLIPLIVISIFRRKLTWDLKVFFLLSLVLLSGIFIPRPFIGILFMGSGIISSVHYFLSFRSKNKGYSWRQLGKIVFKGSKVFLGFVALLIILASSSNVYLFLYFIIGVVLIICSYYIFTSWKTIKGAQWIIVFGLALTILFVTAWFIALQVYASSIFPNYILYRSGMYLSFPLALLSYVAARFKEIIRDVKDNAQKVLTLSEEKREQVLMQQKILEAEVDKQTIELRSSLQSLKSTQSQLIQSEKMASLGELTAGIAHEIQNPLNFVNNFSEVNGELIREVQDERQKTQDKRDDELENELLKDIGENQEKIIHHGKRASSIVQGMLEHSRTGDGTKELTDINALADEYLRLAYHGLRAKDKSFNADFETEFDTSLPKINVVPQDIGRVLLNLINNAFYAVNERAKLQASSYEPRVVISTKRADNKIEIKVADNGTGIPEKVRDKIFQPFFTTKATGEGTGLGLSLSYDIITKGHGGELLVSTEEEGQSGTIFIVRLPND
jgi:signal transduction histidine kinase